MMIKRSVLTSLLVAVATPAFAHVGDHAMSGFFSGFLHPFGGIDHTLAMLGVGLFAAALGAQALWALPISFIGMMLIGGGIGLLDLDIPAMESGIAASVFILGAIVALGWRWSASAAVALVGVFAVFHGYAHGAEIPAGADAVVYGLGFSLASMTLHIAGSAIGLLALRSRVIVRLAGASIAATGFILVLS
jgi:urease accessory protein